MLHTFQLRFMPASGCQASGRVSVRFTRISSGSIQHETESTSVHIRQCAAAGCTERGLWPPSNALGQSKGL